MTIAIIANEIQKEQFLSKRNTEAITTHWLQAGDQIPKVDACFDLTGEDGIMDFQQVNDIPVFVNAVITVSAFLPANVVRINAWPGFLQGNVLEISGNPSAVDKGKQVLELLGWTYQYTSDTPGMISARVLAMIINEAWFAFGEGISTREEIDTAMRLGTNYPLGPFSWCEEIGIGKIYRLLQALGEHDTRYTIAPALKTAYNQELNS